MDITTFYDKTIDITFSNLPIFWKAMTIIGSISTIVFLILLVIIVSLMFETIKKNQDLSEYDDFLNEFANGQQKEEEKENYPILPKIRDFEGNVLKDLLQIEILP
jgi:uncharacterized membrane protein